MIKFFRRIRYDIIERNLPAREGTAKQAGKTVKPAFAAGRYFKYAFGEIILVVIGIVIAVQINTWNENRKTHNIIKNSLTRIFIKKTFLVIN